MANEQRPPVPDPIKRQARQRCGFGCVVCGMPLYEYDHMIDFAIVKTHDAENLTLLCDRHHREKTNNLLPLEAVQAANRDPYNVRAGISPKYLLHFGGKDCELVVGDSRIKTEGLEVDDYFISAIVVDGRVLLGFRYQDERLLLTLDAFDQYNYRILLIQDNELQYSTSPWDLSFEGKNLIIREAKGVILLDVVFEPPSRVVVQRGRFLFNGVEVLIRNQAVEIVNNNCLFRDYEAVNVPFMFVLGRQPSDERVMFPMPKLSRYRKPDANAKPDTKPETEEKADTLAHLDFEATTATQGKTEPRVEPAEKTAEGRNE